MIKHNARVAIGMPVYNGALTIVPVIDSLLAQTYDDFVLFISDNASTDDTEKVCREFARKDARVVYFRQEKNIGAEKNFDYVLHNISAEYFLWAAADDVRSHDFLKVNVEFLDHNPEYLGSTSPTRFEDGLFDSHSMGDETRDEDDPMKRIGNFFGCWHSNARFYSVFRHDAIKEWSASELRFFASDWFFVLALLKKGKLKRLDEGFVVLGRKGISNSYRIFSLYRETALHWVFPFYDLFFHTFKLIGGGSYKVKFKIFLFLLKINMVAVRLQLQYELKERKKS